MAVSVTDEHCKWPFFQDAAQDEAVDLEELKKFDPLAVTESQTMLEPPLRPLPAPMQPEILPSAKVASVRASMGKYASAELCYYCINNVF